MLTYSCRVAVYHTNIHVCDMDPAPAQILLQSQNVTYVQIQLKCEPHAENTNNVICATAKLLNFLKNCSVMMCSFQFAWNRRFSINVQKNLKPHHLPILLCLLLFSADWEMLTLTNDGSQFAHASDINTQILIWPLRHQLNCKGSGYLSDKGAPMKVAQIWCQKKIRSLWFTSACNVNVALVYPGFPNSTISWL